MNITMNPSAQGFLTMTHSWRYSLDEGPWTSTSEATIELRDLEAGEHCIKISAMDLVGNFDPHPRQVRTVCCICG